MNFDWADLAFGSKKPVNGLKATFVLAPRELSAARFTQLVKTYLPAGNIVLGLAKESFIMGFEDQPQFKTLQARTVQTVISKVNASKSPHKIYTLTYAQREAPYLLEKLKFKRVVGVNGSWLHAFHTRPEYYALVNRAIAYELVSPFLDEHEALQYAAHYRAKPLKDSSEDMLDPTQMLARAREAAKQSYDYMFQTGAALGRKHGKQGYELLLTAFNNVVPYQTYAMHHGASRETHFSPPNDLNHYDTVHAEVELIIAAGKQQIDLAGTSLFINLMPCPTCARMLADTDITEVVYQQDHSSGYAVQLLEAAGKTVTRVVV